MKDVGRNDDNLSNLIDYLIVGQGIAGSVLAHTFLKEKKKILVVNTPQKSCASLVAGGIYNPLTGKKLVKTWLADELFSFLKPFYLELEKLLGVHFFHQTPIYRPYRSVQEQNDWVAKSALPEFSPYTQTQVDEMQYQSALNTEFGGIETLQAGWVDTALYLKKYREYLQYLGIYCEEIFDYQSIDFKEGSVCWKGYRAKKIIFCEGANATQNPYFNYLPFTCVKGETLDVEILGCNLESIVNQGISLIPLGNSFRDNAKNQAYKQIYKIASTYSWQPLDTTITEDAKNELLSKAAIFVKLPMRVVSQEAGIRPATKHRRPFVGIHPQYSEMAIFNGLGSKGVSLAPYLANQFYGYLEHQTPLNAEINIEKYKKMYVFEA